VLILSIWQSHFVTLLVPRWISENTENDHPLKYSAFIDIAYSSLNRCKVTTKYLESYHTQTFFNFLKKGQPELNVLVTFMVKSYIALLIGHPECSLNLKYSSTRTKCSDIISRTFSTVLGKQNSEGGNTLKIRLNPVEMTVHWDYIRLFSQNA
jgi:hypothetical protein